MFCSKCGKELPEGAIACPACGEEVVKDIGFQEVTQSVQMKINDFRAQIKEEQEIRKIKDVTEMFVQQDEKQISYMGKGYLNNLLRNGVLSKGFGVLTDKRLYYKGKCFNKSGRFFYKTDEEKIIDLQDITASGFIYRRNIFLMLPASTFTLADVFITPMSIEYSDGLLGLLAFLSIILTLVSWYIYLFYKRTIYEITYAGGKIAIRVSGYGVKEIQKFNKELYRAKDELIKNNFRRWE